MEAEKEKAKKLAELGTGFTPAPKDAPVVNLGVMGNRKKKPETESASNGANMEPQNGLKQPSPAKTEEKPNQN